MGGIGGDSRGVGAMGQEIAVLKYQYNVTHAVYWMLGSVPQASYQFI